MSENLRKYAPFIKSLARASNKDKKKILKRNCSDEFVKACSECIFNLLKGNIPLTPRQKVKLSRRKGLMRKMIDKRTSIKGKKKILQVGGFLGALLGPIVRVIGSLFGAD